MGTRQSELVLDCAEPERLAGSARGARLSRPLHGCQFGLLVPKEGIASPLLLQGVPEPKAGKNRMHLDIVADDIDAEVRRLQALGAHRIDEGVQSFGGTRWVRCRTPSRMSSASPPASSGDGLLRTVPGGSTRERAHPPSVCRHSLRRSESRWWCEGRPVVSAHSNTRPEPEPPAAAESRKVRPTGRWSSAADACAGYRSRRKTFGRDRGPTFFTRPVGAIGDPALRTIEFLQVGPPLAEQCGDPRSLERVSSIPRGHARRQSCRRRSPQRCRRIRRSAPQFGRSSSSSPH